ncbi:hypothetical protein [Jeongeupia naejangsanensis]|uniref:Uncharacterized protein n=1 Tax=Jeongeupia naejangsanensis TaxID=613195 RepID=A0ABS2BLC4_9NEIS|nr:hypothetical protein [Jeongeupia naejangsanensis]MBM3116417.1 hypothetical protein [Jeongeupia naejangsanensis]
MRFVASLACLMTGAFLVACGSNLKSTTLAEMVDPALRDKVVMSLTLEERTAYLGYLEHHPITQIDGKMTVAEAINAEQQDAAKTKEIVAKAKAAADQIK